MFVGEQNMQWDSNERTEHEMGEGEEEENIAQNVRRPHSTISLNGAEVFGRSVSRRWTETDGLVWGGYHYDFTL